MTAGTSLLSFQGPHGIHGCGATGRNDASQQGCTQQKKDRQDEGRNVMALQGGTSMKADLQVRREQLLRELARVERQIAKTQKQLTILEERLAPAKAA